jgi:sec-independent protein translocase protein TatA
MLEYSLNIAGSEWLIIVFVALILILGTGKLPGAAKKLGKAVNEYNKAKDEIQDHIKDASEQTPTISGPVGTEREKLETIAKSIGIKVENKTDDELREIISTKMGKRETDEPKKE